MADTPATAAAAGGSATPPPPFAAASAVAAPFSSKPGACGMPAKELFYTGIHARNIGMVRKLLDVVLPVPYSDDFYRRLQEAPPELARLVYYRDICVGVLGCRVEPGAPPAAAGSAAAPPRVYMTVLAVLAPYRDRGIGSALLRGALEAMEGGRIAGAEGAREMYLHVWEENKEAVRGAVCGGGEGGRRCAAAGFNSLHPTPPHPKNSHARARALTHTPHTHSQRPLGTPRLPFTRGLVLWRTRGA
jgi:GNAT superfamily N-acetyltransferase